MKTDTTKAILTLLEILADDCAWDRAIQLEDMTPIQRDAAQDPRAASALDLLARVDEVSDEGTDEDARIIEGIQSDARKLAAALGA